MFLCDLDHAERSFTRDTYSSHSKKILKRKSCTWKNIKSNDVSALGPRALKCCSSGCQSTEMSEFWVFPLWNVSFGWCNPGILEFWESGVPVNVTILGVRVLRCQEFWVVWYWDCEGAVLSEFWVLGYRDVNVLGVRTLKWNSFGWWNMLTSDFGVSGYRDVEASTC